MSDLGVEHSEGQPKEQLVFPLTREAVNRALHNIAANPDRIFTSEIPFLYDNEELSFGLQELSYKELNCPRYVEGTLFTHRILREQAEMNGKKLPKVTSEVWRAHVREQNAKSQSEPDLSPGELATNQMTEISNSDKEFGRALGELSRYMTHKGDFYYGVVNTYLPLQKMEETLKREKQTIGP